MEPRKPIDIDSLEFTFFLAVFGLVLMYISPGFAWLGGGMLRFAALATGFLAVGAAALFRCGARIERYWLIGMIAGAVLVGVLLLTRARDHHTETQGLLFILVSFCLFLFGYVLGERKARPVEEFGRWNAAALFAVSIVPLYFFLRFLNSIAFFGFERDYGIAELNPIGVAYMAGVLCQVFGVLALFSRDHWMRFPFLGLAGGAFLIVLTSGSKGALLYILLTGALIAFHFLWRGKLTRRSIAWLGIGLCILTVGYAVLGSRDIAIFDRIAFMQERYKTTVHYFYGISGDESIEARLRMWNTYLQDPIEWVFAGRRHYVGYPHNQFVEFIVRFGVIGFFLLGFSLYMLFFAARLFVNRRIPLDVELMLILCVFFFSYLQSMSSLSLEMNRSLWLCFGFLLGFSRRLKDSAPTPPPLSGRNPAAPDYGKRRPSHHV